MQVLLESCLGIAALWKVSGIGITRIAKVEVKITKYNNNAPWSIRWRLSIKAHSTRNRDTRAIRTVWWRSIRYRVSINSNTMQTKRCRCLHWIGVTSKCVFNNRVCILLLQAKATSPQRRSSYRDVDVLVTTTNQFSQNLNIAPNRDFVRAKITEWFETIKFSREAVFSQLICSGKTAL